MKIYGLTGGIGSGKSTVAKLFAERGVAVIDADQIGHDVLLLPDVKYEVRRNWGDTVFDANGEVDRRALAAIVFFDTEHGSRQLETLTRLTHPRIGQKIKSMIDRFEKNREKCVLIDAPLLLEGGWDHYCSDILFIDAPEEIRIARVLTRGWTVEEFHNREKKQFPVEFKRSRATRLIHNDGSMESLERQVDQILGGSSG